MHRHILSKQRHIHKLPYQIILFAVVAVLLVLVDQLSKMAASLYLKDQGDLVLIDGVLDLHYLENTSAAFSFDPVSFLQKTFSFAYFTNHPQAFVFCKMAFFTVLTIVVVVLIAWLFVRIPNTGRFLPANLILTFFVAGALGNFIDRIRLQHVIDFIYFKLINFPVFNVADIYVTVSAVLLVILGLFYYKDKDYDEIFPPAKRGTDEGQTNTDRQSEDTGQM